MNHTDCECPENTEKIRKNLHREIEELQNGESIEIIYRKNIIGGGNTNEKEI